jgi:hypothetical protein
MALAGREVRAADEEQVRLVIAHIERTIGLDPVQWPARPSGYPGQIEAALLDSVFSLRATYGQSRAKGPRAVVGRWANKVGRPLDSLERLVKDVDGLGGPDGFREVLKHDGVAVPRAADKPTKALAVYVTAKALVAFGVIRADDAIRARFQQPKELLRAIQTGRGVGPQAATYFLMNLGVPGVKADVMVKRFVEAALAVATSAEDAANLVTRAADNLEADVIRLDHAIWKHGSDHSRASRPRKSGG